MEPTISVALVTRNRPESLERTLASLRAQSKQPFEVIVSDDSALEYAAVVREIVERFGCRYISGPKRGLYANRNAVALACSGSHIRTMDDDHEFPAGHWAACVAAVVEGWDCIWTIGECIPGEAGFQSEVQPVPQLHPRGYSVPPSSTERSWALADGATIFPRDVFDKGNMYAECFVFGAAYLEFGSRLRWLGYRIENLTTSYVIHHYDARARSVMNADVDLSSQVFAILCHSLRYQRSIRNISLTFGQIGLEILRGGPRGVKCVRSGIQCFRRFESIPSRN